MLFSVIILETRNEIIMIFSIFLILNGLIKVFNLKLKDVISYIFPFDCLKKIFGLFGSKLNNYTFLKYYLWDLFICYAVVFLYSSLIYYYCIIKEKNVLVSISLLFIGILIISSGDFKIRKIMELFKYLPSPVKTNENIFPSECIYDISFFEWMDKFDKEKNYEYYQILYEFLDKKKSKLFKWLKINHMEMSLVRSLGIWYGRENLIRLYFFSVIYTVFYTRSLRKFFEKRYGHFYSDIYFFRNYLLKICMKHFTLNFSQKVKYSSICNYMGERKENWSKEKFFVGCIGFEINEIERRLDQIEERLKNEVFTAEIFNESKYSQIVKKYNLSRSKIKKEILVIEIINDSKYSKIIKKYNLSESEIGRHLRKIVSNE